MFAYHKIKFEQANNREICSIKREIREIQNHPQQRDLLEKSCFSFEGAFRVLQLKGPARIISSRGTEYDVEAWNMRDGRPVIRAKLAPPSVGYIYIHSDCWGCDITCQGVRAGGIYNGKDNIYIWLRNYSSR